MRKAKDIFSILMVAFVFIVIWWFYLVFKQDRQFENQKLGVSISAFAAVWGEPDKISEDGYVLFYNVKNGLGHRYVFRFNINNRLEGKYYDD